MARMSKSARAGRSAGEVDGDEARRNGVQPDETFEAHSYQFEAREALLVAGAVANEGEFVEAYRAAFHDALG